MPLRLPASIRRPGGSGVADGETENLSCDGVRFKSQELFELGEMLEIRLDLSEILGPSHRYAGLVCFGKVIQTEKDGPLQPFRYGCRIEDYRLQLTGPEDVLPAVAHRVAVP